MKNEWEFVKKVEIDGMQVELSAPQLVARSKRYCWFPTLVVLSNDDMIASVSPVPDRHFSATTAIIYRSSDGGIKWNETAVSVDYGWNSVCLAGGDTIILPYYMTPKGDGIGRACNVFRKNEYMPEYVEKGVYVGGWPNRIKSFSQDLNIAGFVFNGQSISARDGTYLTTLYGFFEGIKRMNLVLAESKDGFNWKIRSVIADGDIELKGDDGPSESAICRMKDERIMCIFRMGGFVPYGICFSSDDGMTWTKPVQMAEDVLSVEPSLAVIPDGTVVLSGGRPGIWLWFNRDGNGNNWSKIDIAAHHTTCCPDEPIYGSVEWQQQNSSCYTEVVYAGNNELFLIYDRIPCGWAPIPPDSKDTNSVWVIKVRIR